ncbi:MAG: hypothetical protein JNK76_16055 [Planctomycetales bacterium]|nr:hypothetical protein [Planctomycetales bacterium]
MKLSELERAVARSTGETRREIRRRGFQPLQADAEFNIVPGDYDYAATVGVVDWDGAPDVSESIR